MRNRPYFKKYLGKIFSKILEKNTHLVVHTSTGTKYRRFKHGIPAWLQDLILQYEAFSGVIFSSTIIFLSHFSFHCPLFVMFAAYLKLVMQRKRIQQSKFVMRIISVADR